MEILNTPMQFLKHDFPTGTHNQLHKGKQREFFEFRDDVVLKSKFQKPFENVLDVYYKFSPPIANLMRHNKPFKYTMKYSVVWPFVALVRITAFLSSPFTKKQ